MEAEIVLLRKLEEHLSGKYGVKNSKGSGLLSQRCHVDTVLIASDENSETWKSVTVEPLNSRHGPIFKITCEIEEELTGLGLSRRQKTEELVFAGNGSVHPALTKLP